MRLDAHQHFWSLARGDYDWLTEDMGPIYRDFSPDDLSPILRRHSFDGTILVQAAPTVAETQYLLTLASRNVFVKGVVGWVNLTASDATVQIDLLAKHPALLGFRPMIQDIADPDWMLQPALQPALESMQANQLTLDALTLPIHLPRLLKLVRRYPKLTVVIDHASKPNIAAREIEPWVSDMQALTQYDNCFCKFSGLVTEAKPRWCIDDLRPYTEVLLSSFGSERLIWGSDWPVCTLAASYARWLATSQQLLEGLSQSQLAAVYGGNACRAYRLHGRSNSLS